MSMAKRVKSAALCKASDQLPLEEILSRLPVKSLLKCKCVCKSWRDQIEDPVFISMHLNQSQTNDHGILLYGTSPSKPQVPQYYKYRLIGKNVSAAVEEILPPSEIGAFDGIMVGCCNGLVCQYSSYMCSLDDVKIHIWNPATRKVLLLPPSPGSVADNNNISGIQFRGFGFCRNDYKVVKLTQLLSADAPQPTKLAEVYSLRTNSWKTIDMADPESWPRSLLVSGGSIFINGACYWKGRDTSAPRGNRLRILSYKFEEEAFQLIKPPIKVDNDLSYYPMLKEYANSLALVAENDDKLDVWVMKDEYGESWVKQFSLDVAIPWHETITEYKVVSIGNNGEVVLLNMGNKRIFWYDIKTNTFEQHGSLYRLEDVINYKESLVSLP